MTKIEKEISGSIKNNKGKVKIFWDMDGVISSMGMHLLEKKSDPGYFYEKRPIMTMIKILKKFYDQGAQTYILSLCSYHYQKEEKIKWLSENCPFIKAENIIVIPRKEKGIKQVESKHDYKAEFIKDYITNQDIVYFIDDNVSILISMKEKVPFVNIASPIDFID